MGRPYDIKDRSFLFATEIIDFCKPVMPPGGVVRELARQLLRSGTSIGANLEEADAASAYWLRLLIHADVRLKSAADPLLDESRQLVQILTTIKLNSEQSDEQEAGPEPG